MQKSKKKDILTPLMAIAIFLFGFFMFFYPTISNYFAEKNQEKIIQEYTNKQIIMTNSN